MVGGAFVALTFDRIDRILALYRLRAEDKPQTPAGRMAGSFDITLAGETEDVPVYVGLEDPCDWPGATITLSRSGASDVTVVGMADQAPFFKECLPERAAITVTACRGSEQLGTLQTKVRAPATFAEIRHAQIPLPQVTVTRAMVPATTGRIDVRTVSPIRAVSAATIDIARRDGATVPGGHAVVDLGRTASFDVAVGDVVLTLRTPDGEVQTRDVTVEPGAIVTVAFEMKRSRHEWLGAAVFSGAIAGEAELARDAAVAQRRIQVEKPSPSDGKGRADRGELNFSYIRRSFELESNDGAPMVVRPEPADVQIGLLGAAGLRQDLPKAPKDLHLELRRGPDDGRFLRFDVDDGMGTRFTGDRLHVEGELIFAEIASGGRWEAAVVPTIGYANGTGEGEWHPHLIVDREAAANRPMTTVMVEDPRWSGLLGFLGSRDMFVASRLLDSGLEQRTLEAIRGKRVNPLAAAAGALIAVSVADPDKDRVWDDWLHNLANWFPGLPDGAIILAWRLLNRARSAEDLAMARQWFTKGFRRGVACYSLSVDWLARGLESLPGEDDELIVMQRAARSLANRVDSLRTFTVVRLSR